MIYLDSPWSAKLEGVTARVIKKKDVLDILGVDKRELQTVELLNAEADIDQYHPERGMAGNIKDFGKSGDRRSIFSGARTRYVYFPSSICQKSTINTSHNVFVHHIVIKS